MIKLIIKGGLGNQMFQYAFGKSLAEKRNEPLTLDISFLQNRIPIKNFTYRDYELDLFSIPEKPVTLLNNKLLDKYFSYPTALLLNKHNPYYIKELNDPYKYYEKLGEKALNAPKNADIVIEGYWNNYKYFQDHESEIKQMFSTDKLYDPKFDAIENRIQLCNSVSINIRRGDYLNAKHKDVFVFLDETYYKKAISIVKEKVKDPFFFIFSYDDPEWVKDTLDLKDTEMEIVPREYTGDKFKTYLRLISLCKHNIISNSTFAFWGAYLNKTSHSYKISPARWMSDKYVFEVPTDWITIE